MPRFELIIVWKNNSMLVCRNPLRTEAGSIYDIRMIVSIAR
jgi:hypothetical protein